jgi:hypothetical protein
MSILLSPKIVTDGLVFYYDMNNGKSFIGGPVTNTIPNPSINAFPTYGNGWGTYNTNQYNSNTYFSIGSIASVSGNVVTTSGNHPLRSYDVVTPQTSGGGLSAGANYLIKKLSNTTFTIHPYNSSQDGSQGYINPTTGNHKVYDDFANDVRISINSSSFPTMWWGPPHLPNSALVKEIIPNGFNGIPGRPPTDCIRLHFNRTDATDGMAYGVDASVVAGTPYTVSFWARSVSSSAVGTTGSYQIYNYGSTTPTGASVGYTLGPVGEWRKYTLTFTPNNPLAISYWFPGGSGQKHDIANIQFEAGSVANNFVAGTRINTQSIYDLTGNNSITANNLVYASDGTFSISGADGSNISIANIDLRTSFTLECWVYLTALQGAFFGHGVTTAQQGLHLTISSNYTRFGMYGNDTDFSLPHTTGVWAHYVFTYNHGTYVKGAYRNTVSYTGTPIQTQTPYTATPNTLRIGQNYSSHPGAGMIGKVGLAKMYNRVLSQAEIIQNFNAHRGRYGL